MRRTRSLLTHVVLLDLLNLIGFFIWGIFRKLLNRANIYHTKTMVQHTFFSFQYFETVARCKSHPIHPMQCKSSPCLYLIQCSTIATIQRKGLKRKVSQGNSRPCVGPVYESKRSVDPKVALRLRVAHDD